MERKLTKLEAAMLGLWLCGYQVLNFGEYEVYAYVRDERGFVSKADVSEFPNGEYITDLVQGDWYGEVELLPWLTDHGITPPEVE